MIATSPVNKNSEGIIILFSIIVTIFSKYYWFSSRLRKCGSAVKYWISAWGCQKMAYDLVRILRSCDSNFHKHSFSISVRNSYCNRTVYNQNIRTAMVSD